MITPPWDLSDTEDLLRTHLLTTVPLRMHELRGADPDALIRAHIDPLRGEGERPLSLHAQDLTFNAGHRDRTLRDLTNAIAAAAIVAADGITYLGVHFGADGPCACGHDHAGAWRREGRAA